MRTTEKYKGLDNFNFEGFTEEQYKKDLWAAMRDVDKFIKELTKK